MGGGGKWREVKRLVSSLFSVGKRSERKKMWKSGNQELRKKRPTMNFATKNNLGPSKMDQWTKNNPSKK